MCLTCCDVFAMLNKNPPLLYFLSLLLCLCVSLSFTLLLLFSVPSVSASGSLCLVSSATLKLMHFLPVVSDIYTAPAHLYCCVHFHCLLPCYLSTPSLIAIVYLHTHTHIITMLLLQCSSFPLVLFHRKCPRVYSVHPFR